MKFGAVPVAQALGAVLAHSIKAGDKNYRKGHVLDQADLDLIKAHHNSITVAELEPGDIWENEAAARLASALKGPNVKIAEAFTGRANLIAAANGVLRVNADVLALNSVDEAISLATLPDYMRVTKGQMVATVKIITYAVPDQLLEDAIIKAASNLEIHPFRLKSATVILTETPGLKPGLRGKAQKVLTDRLAGLEVSRVEYDVVPHDVTATEAAIKRAKGDIVLILGGSATSDRRDVCPAALVAAGGTIRRFGMPVDPGNLLFLGELQGRHVVGLPGCVRSPALNGADWVLERLAAGLDVSSGDIAAMGEGGLLKEIPSRPQPRQRK